MLHDRSCFARPVTSNSLWLLGSKACCYGACQVRARCAVLTCLVQTRCAVYVPECIELVQRGRCVTLAVDLQDGAGHGAARDHLLLLGHRALERLLQVDVLQIHCKHKHNGCKSNVRF